MYLTSILNGFDTLIHSLYKTTKLFYSIFTAREKISTLNTWNTVIEPNTNRYRFYFRASWSFNCSFIKYVLTDEIIQTLITLVILMLVILKGQVQFSACSFIKMLFLCQDMLYRLCIQYDHVIMLSKNQSPHSPGSHLHLINFWVDQFAKSSKLINHGINPPRQQ